MDAMSLPRMQAAPSRTDSLAWYPYDESLWKRYVVQSKYGDIVACAEIDDEWIGLPRGLCPDPMEDRRSVGHSIDVSLQFLPKNSEQERVVEECRELLSDGHSFILSATTGFGKTYCASTMIAHLKRTTLIVVTKEDLLLQWKNELMKFLGLKEEEIGIAQQDRCEYQGKKVVIGMVHSLAKDKYGDDFNSYFGLVIYDEVHRMAAETFSVASRLFPSYCRVGLSATTTRSDGKEFLFLAHIGPVLVRTALVQLPPTVMARRTNWQMPLYLKRYKAEGGKLMHVYKALAADNERNNLIVSMIAMSYRKERNIIVFSDLKESHLSVLFSMSEKAGVPAHQMSYYVGGMSEKAREHAKKNCRVLFATYAMAAEATDIPRLDTAILATPRSNILQPVGRVLRECDDKKTPVIFDLVDDDLQVLEAYYRRRCMQYKSLCAQIVEFG